MHNFDDREFLLGAISDVLDSGQLIMGPNLAAFEVELANFFGCGMYAAGVANATDAIEILLRSLGLSATDEVAIPSFAPVPVIAGVIMAGVKPILIDVDLSTATMAADSLASKISENTRVVMPVHMYGNAANLDSLSTISRGMGALLVEDISQAFGSCDSHGRRLGSIGDAAVLSMYPTKNLAAVGDAGAVITSREDLVARFRGLRQYGWDQYRVSQYAGRNSRLDELQAAVLLGRLSRFEHFIEQRKLEYTLISAWVTELGLGRIITERPPASVPHLFVIEPKNRHDVVNALRPYSLVPGIHYPHALHQHPAFKSYGTGSDLQASEHLAATVVTIPWTLHRMLGKDS